MRVKPRAAYRHDNYPASTALDPTKEYDADIAYNQPNYKAEGKIFVTPPNGAPSLLLQAGEYDVVEDENPTGAAE